MRARTLLAGTTLALLVAVWSAPAALAAENNDSSNDGNSPPVSKSQPRKQQSPSAEPKPGANQSQDNTPSTQGNARDNTINPVNPGDANKVLPKAPDPKASLSVSPGSVRPGDTINANARCENSQQSSLTAPGVNFQGNTGRVDQNAGDGGVTVTLVCGNSAGKTATATATFRVNRGTSGGGGDNPGGNNPGPGGDPRARLSLSDDTGYPGDIFSVRAQCDNSNRDSLNADRDVSFGGDNGRIDRNAQPGRIKITLKCTKDGKSAEDSAYYAVRRSDDRKPWLDVSPNAGYRDDDVRIAAFCPDGVGGRIESKVLNDITLRRDGDRLRGTTKVTGGADYGRDGVKLICDNGRGEDTNRFYVRGRDRDEFLDLNPSFGKRGDEIDVNVGCDRSVSRLDSNVLENVDLYRNGNSDWHYEGTAKVLDNAAVGEHTIKIKCGDQTLEQSFFVHGDGDSSTGGDQVTVYPKGAPETGGGPAEFPLGALLLGVTGLLGAGLAGAGAVAEQRAARR